MRSVVVLVTLLTASGCATTPLGPSIAHDEAQLFRASHFDWPRLKSGGLALLGVTPGLAPAGIREDVDFVLDQAASNHLSRVRVVPRSDALARAQEVGMRDDVTRLMQDYDQSGTVDAGLLRRLAAAEGVRYFLLTRIVQFERTTRPMSGPTAGAVTSRGAQPKRATERVQRVRLRGEVWDSRCGDLVWTGEGGTEVVEETTSEEVRLQDVLAMAATNLVSQLPRSGDVSKATGKECGA